MDRLTFRQAIKSFEDERIQEREKASHNATCFYPCCPEIPIKSHIISQKLLRRIAENSHVLTWLSSDTPLLDMYDAFDAGKPVEHINMIPELVGIGNVKLTDPLFCQCHDKGVFKKIEDKEIASRSALVPKQVLLLAYRALCSLTFQLSDHQSSIDAILEFSRKVGHKHSLSEPERYASLHRFLAKDTMLALYKRHEQIRMSGDYSQLDYALYIVGVPPCIATTYSFIPLDDNETKAIIDGTLLLNPEDAVSFTFLPHTPLSNSICVMSWLRESQRARRFMARNRINELFEKEQQDLFFHFAFESPTVYISPDWWNSLSGEKRVEYTLIHFNAAREHAALI